MILRDYYLKKKLGMESFIIFKIKDIDKLKKYKKKFITLILNKKILTKKKIRLISKLILFKKKVSQYNKKKINVRYAVKKDLNQILSLLKKNRSFSRLCKDKLISKKIKKNYYRDLVTSYLFKKRGDYAIVYQLNNKILGVLLLIKEKKMLRIDLIATKIKNQRKGISTKLLEFTEQKLCSSRINTITCGVHSDNINAIRFYKKNHFKKYGIRYYYHIFDK